MKQITDHLGNKYKTQTEMCKKYGISSATYTSRIKKGWSKKKALTTPTGKKSNKSNITKGKSGSAQAKVKDIQTSFKPLTNRPAQEYMRYLDFMNQRLLVLKSMTLKQCTNKVDKEIADEAYNAVILRNKQIMKQLNTLWFVASDDYFSGNTGTMATTTFNSIESQFKNIENQKGLFYTVYVWFVGKFNIKRK